MSATLQERLVATWALLKWIGGYGPLSLLLEATCKAGLYQIGEIGEWVHERTGAYSAARHANLVALPQVGLLYCIASAA